jgi:hypothetical protein
MDWNLPLNYTMAQIQAASKAQIIAVINTLLNTYSKRQIIVWLLNNTVKYPREPVIVYDSSGKVTSQTQINYDVETGLQADKRVIIWTYYPNGDVNVITVSLLDANNNVMSTQTIQHYQNGQQPTSVIT